MGGILQKITPDFTNYKPPARLSKSIGEFEQCHNFMIYFSGQKIGKNRVREQEIAKSAGEGGGGIFLAVREKICQMIDAKICGVR